MLVAYLRTLPGQITYSGYKILSDIPKFALIISIRIIDQSHISSKMYKVESKLLHFNVYNNMKGSQKCTLSEN